MDPLLKIHNKLQFLHSGYEFAVKFSPSKPHHLEPKFHPNPTYQGVCVNASSGALLELVQETKKENLEFDTLIYDPFKNSVVDLAVVGGGPAGLVVVAQQVCEVGLTVCSIDSSLKPVWPNNYDVWIDEFKAIYLLDCLDTT